MDTTTQITVGSKVKITRSVSRKHPDYDQPPGPGSIFQKVGEETFVAEVDSVSRIGNKYSCHAKEIDGGRVQSFSFPSDDVEILELADAPERQDIRFGVPVVSVVRGRWAVGEWVDADDIPEDAEIVSETTTTDTEYVWYPGDEPEVEHVAEWDGEGYTIKRADRKTRPWEIRVRDGEIESRLIESRVTLPTLDWTKKEAKQAYRQEMKAVVDSLREVL